ncbi:MAG: hypothetical protein IJY24_03595 [Clostridia bacterium]|nr:hypothetical protein [Clostridia bacterium]
MKEFVCELCDSTQFTKSNGLFICSGCGTQYTLQEMRALSREVPDGTPHTQNATPQPTYTPPAPQPQPTYTPPAPQPQPTYTPPAPQPQPTYTPPAPQPTYTPPAPQPQPVQQPQPTTLWSCQCGTINSGNFCVRCGKQKAQQPPTSTVHPTTPAVEKPKKKKGKITFGKIFSCILCGLSAFLFIVSLINALSPDSTDGNWMLLCTGIGELIVAFIAYKIMIHMERYNCPACGGKREHHREFLRTTSKVQTYPNQDGTNTTETYTHHYRDTYVCPACGETRVEQTTGSGGSYTESESGRVNDKTIPPKEF